MCALLLDETGQTGVEYGAILALVVTVVLGLAVVNGALGDFLSGLMDSIASAL